MILISIFLIRKEFDHLCPCLRVFVFPFLLFYLFVYFAIGSLLIDLRDPLICEENKNFVFALNCKVSFSVCFHSWFLFERFSNKRIFSLFF